MKASVKHISAASQGAEPRKNKRNIHGERVCDITAGRRTALSRREAFLQRRLHRRALVSSEAAPYGARE
ncbi:hypothetical protein AAFF_G00058540 [Aldrovandia affinis]|uniref:Uncharacterized protein n=1 Tax=Aldrovandia affinis TaxID=143900 RepID=A0AAD7S0J9_9TELE|nr:hypothetical protein AAFF_G00058540 [Aldrovandia affinis]